MQKAYIGVDVSCAKKKKIPVVICIKKDGRLEPLPLSSLPFLSPEGHGNLNTLKPEMNEEYARAVKKYVERVCAHYSLQPAMIAIDSPLYPRVETIDYRLAEKALSQAGISCYKTPSASEFETIRQKANSHMERGGELSKLPHPMQIWMLAGFEIAQELASLAPVIEVYPQATIRRLLKNTPHKSKNGIAAQQLRAIARFTGWPATNDDWQKLRHICAGPLHDKVDAYSAAWVASLKQNEREVFGSVEDNDAIWVPALSFVGEPLANNDHSSLATSKVSKLTRKAKNYSDDYTKLCPACEGHLFKRWPWGWDAHAAYRCKGVTGATAELRKAQYKKKFL